MQVITAQAVAGKKVLLRLDIDVAIEYGQIIDDFRLKRGLETVQLCADHAIRTTIIGHIGRPEGEDKELSTQVVAEWLGEHLSGSWKENAVKVMENLRFDKREDSCDEAFAHELVTDNEIFINEAFAAHHQATSTTIVPKLLPHFAGLNFFKEVGEIRRIREQPKRPLVAIIGGAKLEDKYPAVLELSKFCDTVLVGGLVAARVLEEGRKLAENVVLASLSENGLDISSESITDFKAEVAQAKQVIWSGPLGKYEDPLGNFGNCAVVAAILASGAFSIVGGGDTVAALDKLGALAKMGFVSTGGGAMLELLIKNTLPTIEALV